MRTIRIGARAAERHIARHGDFAGDCFLGHFALDAKPRYFGACPLNRASRISPTIMPRLIRILTILLAFSLPGRAAAQPPIGDRLAPHPTRLVVKYAESIDACVHCMLERGLPLASLTGSGSLDALHERLGVTGARALFLPVHTLDGGRSALYMDRVAAVRRRFPVRSARIPAGAALPDLSRSYVLDLPKGTDVHAVAQEYARDPSVEYAAPDHAVHVDLFPDDPFLSTSGTWGQSYQDLWGLHTTGVPTAWDTTTGAGVIVAVIDTGVDPTHSDIAANMWTNAGETPGNGIDDDGNGFVDDVMGWDFNENDATPDDEHGHGTHVAGTAAAVGNNGLGVVGMAWSAQVMAVKGLSDFGSGFESDLAAAIVYASENGADVLNNSWGGNHDPGQVMLDAVDTATGLGAVVVASAGNDGGSVDGHSPSSIPQVIAVGASEPDDTIAGFSNFGQALSVAAPGLDVLSLLGPNARGLDGRPVVATDYVRLSGTSMAAPHVSGLIGLVLAALPTLTPDEVRWQLEVNADQPGYAGWEGLPWNPFFGFGRINAARAFDPVGVRTRLRSPEISLHEYEGTSRLAATAEISFTSVTPISWTLTAPPWLIPSAGAGSGMADLSFDVDTTGLTRGPYSAAIVVSAPAADDGGGSLPVSLEVHSDTRIGGELFLLDSDARFPVAASDGLGTVVFYRGSPNTSYSVSIDGAGNVSPPVSVYVSSRGHPSRNTIATDGRNYLVSWVEADLDRDYILAQRLSATGEPIDIEPIELHVKRVGSAPRFLRDAEVAFDGESYIVIWLLGTDHIDTIYGRRVGTDGTLRGKRRVLYRAPRIGSSTGRSIDIACNLGECLLVFRQFELDKDGDGDGDLPDRILAARLVGDRLVGDPQEILVATPGKSVRPFEVAADGTGYFVLARRETICAGLFSICEGEVLGIRVTADGTPLDPDGIPLTPGVPARFKPSPKDLVFDGTSYLATFFEVLPKTGKWTPLIGFGIRIGLDGSVLTTEQPGTLFAPGATNPPSDLVATREHAIYLWRQIDGEDETEVRSVRAQRLLPHAPPSLPAYPIGAIGAQSVNEGQTLAFTVDAPGLDSSTTTWTTTGLPPGAVFDPYFRTFQWLPRGNESGTYFPVHFEASDGVQTLIEDVPVNVNEARLSISGIAQTPAATAVPNAAIKLRGRHARRTVFTDADGRYLFDDLVPGSYRVRLTKPTRKAYRAAAVRVFVVDADVTVDLTLEPKS